MNESARAGTRSRIRSWVVWAVLLGSAALALAAVKSYGDLRAAQVRELVLSEKIGKTREEIGELGDRIHRLRNDPTELERLARQELGLVKPGDVVIILPEPASHPDKSRLSSPPQPREPGEARSTPTRH